MIPGELVDISIHAPRTGSDVVLPAPAVPETDFNPRSPYGERQQAPVPGGGSRDFNPRSPYGERHGFLTFPLHLSNFNPRSPYGERRGRWSCSRRWRNFNPRSPYGERQCRSFVRRVQCRFQSTLPVRGATPQGLSVVVHRLISIHAPRTGSDARYSSKYCRLSEFQSTLPVRGATW